MRDELPWRSLGVDDVITATNGRDALSLCNSHNVDLIITDIRVPRMDGIELARRAAEEHPETIVVFLTAPSKFEHARTAVRIGAVDYIRLIVKGIRIGSVKG